jgi:hypothetical protein
MPRGGKREGAGRKRKTAAGTPEAHTHTDSPVQAQPQEVPAVAADVVIDNPHGLTPKELLFVEAYCGAARFSATKAYELAGYSMRGAGSSSRANAIKVLTKPDVEKAVTEKLALRVQQLSGVMTGEEALERLSTYARSDIGLVLGENDPISKLPLEVRQTIKSVRPTRYGTVIELYDAMKATELMAKAGGKLKDHVEHSGKVTLEDIVAGDAPQDGAAA